MAISIAVLTDDNKDHTYQYTGTLTNLIKSIKSIGSEGFLMSVGTAGFYYPPHRVIRVTVSTDEEKDILPVMNVTSRKLSGF